MNDVQIKQYTDQLSVQMRKGTLVYCVLKVCSGDPVYANDIVKRLRAADIVAVEGTIYAILSRFQKDGLMQHEWKISEQGPPRKYYQLTPDGEAIRDTLEPHIDTLILTLTKLKKGNL